MFQDPTTTAAPGGTGIVGWRTNATSAAAAPAGRLLVAGEFSGEWNVETTMTVSADGSLDDPVLVTISVTGGTATFDQASDTLTSGGTVEFGVTPTSLGTLTFTFSAPGLTSAELVFSSEDPEPALPDLTDLWRIEADPSDAFEASQGTVPSGVVAHAATTTPYSPALESFAGFTNKIKGSITLGNSTSDLQVNLWQSSSYLTATEYQRGVEDPTYAMLSRVADPLDGAKWCYRHEGDKTKIGFSSSTVKWRSFVQATDDAFRFDPWGTELWVVGGFILDADWVHAEQGPFHSLIGFHNGPGGLMGGAEFAVDIWPGNGNAADLQLEIEVKRYKRDTWPQVQDPKKKTSYTTVTNIAGGLPTGQKFWVVLHFKTGNGFPDYPGYDPAVGGNPGNPVWGVYGSTDPLDPFVEVYYAAGTDDPTLIYRWDDAYAKSLDPNIDGFWGAPHATKDSAASKAKPGYIQVGMYTSSQFKPAAQIGNVLGFYSKGYQQYRARDIWRVSPGVYDPNRASAKAVLAAFRTAR